MQTIGIKANKTKKGRKLPFPIIKLIRDKNKFARKVESARLTSSLAELKPLEYQLSILKAEIKDALASLMLQRRHNLRSKVLRADPSRKKFWRFLKTQIRAAGNITALNDKKGQMVFSQDEIEDVVLEHFSKIFVAQRIPVFTSSTKNTNQVDITMGEMELILNKDITSFHPTTFEEQVCTP